MHLVRAAQTEKKLSTNLFDEFWLLYPRKEGKKECRQVWDRIPESEHIPILEAVVAWRHAWSAQGRSTSHIKMPREWLITERWTDEIPTEFQMRTVSGFPSLVEREATEPRGPIPKHIQEVIDKLKAKR